MIVDLDVDATLVTSHSEKEHAAPTFKKGFGFHPLWSFVDHGAAGTGEPLSVLLRPGNAGSNTASDHIVVIKAALAQLPSHRRGKRAGRKVLIRTDGAGCTHKVAAWMSGQRLYSVGFPLPHNTSDLLELIPAGVWTPAYDAHDQIRDGAWVAELTALLDLTGWPIGMRVIVRKERPHPGAQLRITDVDGHRVTAFATNAASSQTDHITALATHEKHRPPSEASPLTAKVPVALLCKAALSHPRATGPAESGHHKIAVPITGTSLSRPAHGHVVPDHPRCAEIPTHQRRTGRPTRHGCLMHQGLEQDVTLSRACSGSSPTSTENSRSTAEFGTPRIASGTFLASWIMNGFG